MKTIPCPGKCGKTLQFDEESLNHLTLHTYDGLGMKYNINTDCGSNRISYRRAISFLEMEIATVGMEIATVGKEDLPNANALSESVNVVRELDRTM